MGESALPIVLIVSEGRISDTNYCLNVQGNLMSGEIKTLSSDESQGNNGINQYRSLFRSDQDYDVYSDNVHTIATYPPGNFRSVQEVIAR